MFGRTQSGPPGLCPRTNRVSYASRHDRAARVPDARRQGDRRAAAGPGRRPGRRAEQGAPLPAILHSYRVAATFLWAVVLAEAAGDEAAAAALLPAAAELWSQVDELSSAVTD